MQNMKVQLVRPPISVRLATAGYLFAGSASYRAFFFVSHNLPPIAVWIYSFRCI